MNLSLCLTIHIKRQVGASYCRGNMIIQKFSKCSVDVNNQLFRSYVSCLYCCALWKDYSILILHLIRLELHTIMSTKLSWGLKGCMGIAFVVNMSTIVLMVLKLLKEN